MAARKRSVSPAGQDIAKSQRRAKAAGTPAAKRVVETKRRAHSGEAARQAAAEMRRGVHPLDVGTTPKRAAAARKTRRR